MKQRILTGWTINRIIFVLMGLAIGLQAAMQSEWLGILLGGYFMSMGILPLAVQVVSAMCHHAEVIHPSQR